MALANPKPPTLPLERSHAGWRPVRTLVLGLVQAALLLLLANVFDGLTVAGFGTAVAAVVVIALLSGFVWPLAVRLTAPVVMLTAGLFTFVLNAALIWLASELVDGFEVTSFWVALFVAFAMASVSVVVGGMLHVDDDRVWHRYVIGRVVRHADRVETTDVPGFLFIQIDGLGQDVLVDAMASGHAPMLARLVAARRTEQQLTAPNELVERLDPGPRRISTEVLPVLHLAYIAPIDVPQLRRATVEGPVLIGQRQYRQVHLVNIRHDRLLSPPHSHHALHPRTGARIQPGSSDHGRSSPWRSKRAWAVHLSAHSGTGIFRRLGCSKMLGRRCEPNGGAWEGSGNRAWESGGFPGTRKRSREGFREPGTPVWEVVARLVVTTRPGRSSRRSSP